MREQQAAANNSKMFKGPTSLIPTHHNLVVGHAKEKSYDKGFASTLEKVKVEEGDGSISSESEGEGEAPEEDIASREQQELKSGWRSARGKKKESVKSKRVKVLGSFNGDKKYSKKQVRIDEPVSSWDARRDDDGDEEDPEGVDLGYFGAWIARARTMFYESKALALNTAKSTVQSITNIKHQIKDKYVEFLGPPKVQVRGGDMWASKSAWYLLMVMSRLSRIQLVARGTALLAIQVSFSEFSCFLGRGGLNTFSVIYFQGERIRVVLREATPETQQEYYSIKQNLQKATKSLIVMPQTLREMMQRPFSDLRAIFDSQTVHYKLLREMEDLMDAKNVGQLDCFVSMVHIAPCLRRDLMSFDRSIYDVESFNECMKYEAEVTEMKLNERFNSSHAIEEKERKWGETHYAHPAAAHVSKKSALIESGQEESSLGSLNSSLVGGMKGSVAGSDNGNGNGQVLRSFEKYVPEQLNPPPVPAKRPSPKEEAKEDAKLGKMTYSFSHILDGMIL